jgi:hypothetical protein
MTKSSPLGDYVAIRELGCLSFRRRIATEESNHLTESIIEILRLAPQNDIKTQSLVGEGRVRVKKD